MTATERPRRTIQPHFTFTEQEGVFDPLVILTRLRTGPLSVWTPSQIEEARVDFMTYLRCLTPHLRAELRLALAERRISGEDYARPSSRTKTVCGCIIGTVHITELLDNVPELRGRPVSIADVVDQTVADESDAESPMEVLAYGIMPLSVTGSTLPPTAELTPEQARRMSSREFRSRERTALFLAWMDQFDALPAPIL